MFKKIFFVLTLEFITVVSNLEYTNTVFGWTK